MLVYGFTPRSYPRCYKYKCKRNIVDPPHETRLGPSVRGTYNMEKLTG